MKKGIITVLLITAAVFCFAGCSAAVSETPAAPAETTAASAEVTVKPAEKAEGETFWGETCIAEKSDTLATIQYAAVDEGSLVLEGSFRKAENEDDLWNDVNTSTESGSFSYPIGKDARLGMTGGDADPETVDPAEFNSALKDHVENKTGIGLVFRVEDGTLKEAWIAS